MFKNIAGYEDEKKAVLNIIKMFNNYSEYYKLGVKLPKGLLFSGEPGVGKTLFAKAIAKELGRKFYELEAFGDKNFNLYQNIKNLFDKAKSNSPSIVFIDEIDKIIPSESFYNRFISDNSRNTLTLLLQLLDGFNTNGEIMVIATTNNIDALPKALIRSGRIDKHIYLPKPDFDSRLKIINLYLDKINIKKDIDLNQLNLSFDGLNCADISNIINQAFIEALNSDLKIITTNNILKQMEMVLNKNITKPLDDKESEIVAVHELGHYVALKHFKKELKEISINKAPNSLGRVRYRNSFNLKSVEDLKEEIIIALSARAAEEIILGKAYLGSRGDVESAYGYAKDMVLYGEYGFEYIEIRNNVNIGDSLSKEQLNKVSEILDSSMDIAYEIIGKYFYLIEYLTPILKESKTLANYQLESIINDFKKIEKNFIENYNSYSIKNVVIDLKKKNKDN